MSFVIKGTPPGYDVKTAADYLLSLNSSWPLLKLHETGNFSGTVNHNLGYPPFHMLARPASGIGTSDGRIDQEATNFGVNSSTLARSSGSGNPRYFIFRLDLTTNFTAPNISTSTAKTPSSNDYVFKMSKSGKDTDSADMRDFSLHSNTKSPMIHEVNYGGTVGGAFSSWERTVNHNLGYAPIAFAFMKPGANTLGFATDRFYIVHPPVGVSSYYYTVDATKIYFNAYNADIIDPPQVSIVILKDPFTKDVVNVSYP